MQEFQEMLDLLINFSYKCYEIISDIRKNTNCCNKYNVMSVIF